MDPIVRAHSHPLRSVLVALLLAALSTLAATVMPVAAHADWVRDDQWQLGVLNATAAWRYSTGSGITVAVLDSGVDANHPDLVGQVLPGADFVDGTSDGRTDLVGHGTTVAALIAGRRDDNGVVGLAPDARILPVRVLDQNNRYSDAAVVAKGVRWAVDHGARIINLSLGGVSRNEALGGALAYAAQHDVVVIACTGNVAQTTGDPQVWYPAREPGVVAVTGLRNPGQNESAGRSLTAGADPGGPLWTGSLTGPQTVLSAPAADLLGARPGGYWRVQGTSFAAPLVAATAALLRARYPYLSAGNVINHLISTARDLGAEGRDNLYGFGEVDPLTALTAELSDISGNPLWVTADGGADPVHELAAGVVTAPPGGRRAARSAGRSGAWPALVMTGLFGVAAVGVALSRRRVARRYLRRPRHAR
jgi:type VII secretion-associated serine protease mycosin